MSTNRTKRDPEAEFEAEFLRQLACQLDVTELSEDTLAKCLGLDTFTDENLEKWLLDRMRQWLQELNGPSRQGETVVQTEPTRRPLSPGPAGSGQKRRP